jgi:hypothetical protein
MRSGPSGVHLAVNEDLLIVAAVSPPGNLPLGVTPWVGAEKAVKQSERGALHSFGPAERNGASRPMPPEKSSCRRRRWHPKAEQHTSTKEAEHYRGAAAVTWDSTSTREQEEGFAEPPSPLHHGRSGLGTPTMPAQCSPPSPPWQVKGRTKQADLATNQKLAPKHLIEGCCYRWHPSQDPSRIRVEVTDNGPPDAVQEHQMTLSPYHLMPRPRPRSQSNLPTTAAGRNREDGRHRELDTRDEVLIEENPEGRDASTPTTGAGASPPELDLHWIWTGSSELLPATPAKRRGTYSTPTGPTPAPLLCHLQLASPLEGLGIRPGTLDRLGVTVAKGGGRRGRTVWFHIELEYWKYTMCILHTKWIYLLWCYLYFYTWTKIYGLCCLTQIEIYFIP